MLFFTTKLHSLTLSMLYVSSSSQMAKKRPAKPTIVGSPFGTPNGNKTNKDDNDDDKDPIKPSPFKKNKVSSLQKGPPTMKIIHVVPKVSLPIDDPEVSTGEEGFTIIIEGFMQNKQSPVSPQEEHL